MGLHDRDYYRESESGVSLRTPKTIVVTLIIINAVVYLANGLLTPPDLALAPDDSPNTINDFLAVSNQTLWRPWLWWQFLTYGFVHDPSSVMHIFFNMLQLWFLGRIVEQHYGRAEFLRLYLVMLVAGSVVWAVGNVMFEPQQVFDNGVWKPITYHLIGASGAVSGVVILFVLNYPKQTLILFPIPIPIKAWIIGVLLVVGNVWGAFENKSNVAFSVHLVGIAFAYVYFRNRWNLSRLTPGRFSLSKLKPRPRLRIHDPTDDEVAMSKEVDRILEKIHTQGEASLTRKERRTLENASRQYKERRDG
ncbi:MAG: rhomboid family intramembrane serine protease [Thermoguttaceae bacterium]